ncbi:MAG: FtsW/RodA/SpoVE family cell cycle protein [Bryobacteraceae bacterium]
MPQLAKTDRTLFYTTVVMTCFGLLMVYSASSVMAELKYGSASHFALRQGAFLLLGLATMMLFKRLPYRLLQSPVVAFAALGGAIISLGIAYALGARHRWLNLGFGINLQPSEFAKPAVVIFLAYFIAKRARAINDKHTVRPAFLAVGLIILCVAVADLGYGVLIALTAAVLFYVAGLERRYFLALVGFSFLAGGFLIAMKPYRLARVIQFVDPKYEFVAKVDRFGWVRGHLRKAMSVKDTNYQAEQSKIAVGAGGVTGLGLMQGKQKLLYLPEAHTDFIYAVIAEEWGMIGAVGVLAGFGFILWRGFRIALETDDDFARYLAIGLTTVVVLQALINISVVLGMGPTKGFPLPMISSGGSSLVATMAAMGILMNVSEHS